MPSRQHFESSGSIRHTAVARNIDFIVYKSWKCSMKREEQVTHSFLGFEWKAWEKAGNELGFTAQWQDGSGTLVSAAPIAVNETGYRSAEHLLFFAGSPPEEETVTNIDSMRMTYGFGGDRFELVEGKNWVTYSLAIGVLILLILTGAWLGLLVL